MLNIIGSIIILCSSINTGDRGAANQLFAGFQKKNEAICRYDVEAHIDEKRDYHCIEKEYADACSACGDERHLLLVVGEKGIAALSELNKEGTIDRKKSYVAVVTHQHNKLLENKELPIDHLSIPSFAVSTYQIDEYYPHILSKYLMFGMPTKNQTMGELKESYDSWNISSDIKPPTGKPYIFVMLPGDAPDELGVMHYFTKESAQKLADYVKMLHDETGYMVLIHNGPRTGKHDPETGKVACDHVYSKGQDPSIAKDVVSEYFEQYLQNELKVPSYVFNFSFYREGDRKVTQSSYHPLLYLASCQDVSGEPAKSYFIVPGESISMLGQVPLYLFSDKVIAFEPDSMNNAHKAMLNQLFSLNYVSKFDDNGAIIKPKSIVKRIDDDARAIATSILNCIEKRCD